jgi:hypothetical protein
MSTEKMLQLNTKSEGERETEKAGAKKAWT